MIKTKPKIYAVSNGRSGDAPENNAPMWVVRGGDPRELAVLASMTEFLGNTIEAVGAHCMIAEGSGGAVRVTVQYKKAGGPVRYGEGDADHQVYVCEIDEDHARMWTGPAFHGSMYDSPDEIEYGSRYRDIARLAVRDQDVLRERVAGREALAALAGEYGFEQPSISRVGWLETLLDEIDALPEVLTILERDDAKGLREILRECRALAKDGMKVIRDRYDAANPEPEGEPDELPVYRS